MRMLFSINACFYSMFKVVCYSKGAVRDLRGYCSIKQRYFLMNTRNLKKKCNVYFPLTDLIQIRVIKREGRINPYPYPCDVNVLFVELILVHLSIT